MPSYLTEEQQAQWSMKKPVQMVGRIARRSPKGKGKGRSKGKGNRRRLHGRGILAFLASLTGPQHEEMYLGTGRNRGHASGRGIRGDEEIQIMPTAKLWSATYVTAHNISDANAPKVTEEAGACQCTWLKRTPAYSMLIGSRF
eukprot:2087043-Pyramimonas_sp.AAC.1